MSLLQLKSTMDELKPLGKLIPTLQSQLKMGNALKKAQGLRQGQIPPSDQERVEAAPGPPFHYLPDLLAFIQDDAKWAQALAAILEANTVSRLAQCMLGTSLYLYYCPLLFQHISNPVRFPVNFERFWVTPEANYFFDFPQDM